MTAVFLVVGVRAYRDVLATRLAEKNLRIIGSSSTPAAGLATLSQSHEPLVVVLDANLRDAPATATRIAATGTAAAVLLVAIDEDAWDIRRWSGAPIAGYLDAGAAVDDLVYAIEAVARGETTCSPSIAMGLLRRLGSSGDDDAPHRSLTTREHEIASLVACGLSNKEIARRLCIALPTVKNHVHSILGKLGAQRRSQAAARLNGEAGPSPF